MCDIDKNRVGCHECQCLFAGGDKKLDDFLLAAAHNEESLIFRYILPNTYLGDKVCKQDHGPTWKVFCNENVV